MASYRVEWKRSAEQDLRNIDKQFIHRILNEIDFFTNNPFPEKHSKLRGVESTYRLRIGDYRLIYQVDLTKRLVLIYHIRHRREIYRKLK